MVFVVFAKETKRVSDSQDCNQFIACGPSMHWVICGMLRYRVLGCDHQSRVFASECSFVCTHKIGSGLFSFSQDKAMAISISHQYMVTRMEGWKFMSTMLLVKVKLLVRSIRPFIFTVWCSFTGNCEEQPTSTDCQPTVFSIVSAICRPTVGNLSVTCR